MIAEPLGLATQENLDFALFCYMYKQDLSLKISHCKYELIENGERHGNKSKFKDMFLNFLPA